ncbi:hypothetical protein BJY01DRAFT_161360 [Aspergillus pseudoustus]|uniref:Inner kinetochore subunit AME1 domain-containing protein n=1 Tax=Aspergillus pseudoustus TaxID=1810923 RepID=A0ABR4K795_9EURO
MASNRVERLQMRQRGAGTRKIKEVDFGFSLFGAPAEESSQTASQPTNSFEPAPAPAPPPQPPPLDAPTPAETATAEPTESEPIAAPTEDNATSQEQSTNRELGSARNSPPSGAPMLDTAADEEIELGRSSKRRRIETRTEASLPPDAQHELENGVSEPHAVAEPTVPILEEQIAIPNRDSASSSQNQPQHQAPSTITPPIPTVDSIESISKTSDVPPTTENNEPPAPIEPEPVRTNDTTSPPSDTSKTKGRGRGRKLRSSPSQSDVTNSEPVPTEVQPTMPPQPTETPQEYDAPPEIEPAKPQKEKRGRSRKPATQPAQITAPTDEAPVEDTDSGSLSKNESMGKKTRGRKRKNQEVTEKNRSPRRKSEETSANEAERVTEVQDAPVAPHPTGLSEGQPNGVDKGKKRAGRPRKLVPRSPEPPKEPSRADKKKKRDGESEANQEPEDQPGSDTSRAPKRRKRRGLPEPDVEQREQPEPEDGAFRADKRRKREELDIEGERPSEEEAHQDREAETSRAVKRKKGREEKERQSSRRQQAMPEQEPEPEPEVERAPQAAAREQTKPTKGRRGRRPAIQPEEQPAEEGAAAEASQPTKRKPRQPRGETVPVTVHRIANATSLSGAPIEAQSASEDEAGSADEAAYKQTAKLSTRGGVNPADVLAQICRETLEKTLTTLKNGIDNEANAARRQEWTLRRKAVEAFGAELEGRLFELSEMLDSNFMLGVKAKKAKRNMMDLRARLDQVRKEREAVALKMDAVRREHMIREESRMARSTINHSLHNLDLALERGQNRTSGEDESLTAGLEYRLRTAAQNVSSTAPGAHGGILNQIKRFNAQLEATARKLED